LNGSRLGPIVKVRRSRRVWRHLSRKWPNN